MHHWVVVSCLNPFEHVSHMGIFPKQGWKYSISYTIIPPSRSILGKNKVPNTLWWLNSLRLTSSQVVVVDLDFCCSVACVVFPEGNTTLYNTNGRPAGCFKVPYFPVFCFWCCPYSIMSSWWLRCQPIRIFPVMEKFLKPKERGLTSGKKWWEEIQLIYEKKHKYDFPLNTGCLRTGFP